MPLDKTLRELEKKLEELRKLGADSKLDMKGQLDELRAKIEQQKKEAYANLSPWQVVQLMRHPSRPKALDYVERVLTDWMEIHGDHMMADDKSVITGFGRLDGQRLGVVGNQKGKDTKENLLRNFGMAQPEGYRKALRFMRMCERFGLPILTLIDTSGAYPGVEGEERSVAEAIARNLFEMSRFRVPIIVVIIGEGGSGGALGIGVGDRVLMLENAFYSVISPEGCAAILWHDRAKAEEAAAALNGTATQLKKLGIIDQIVAEPLGGAHTDPDAAARSLKEAVLQALTQLQGLSLDTLVEQRYAKFRAMGSWTDVPQDRVAG